MKKKMLHFLRQQNKGAAIVIVIVAMAFVGILSATIMWMSLMNFRMKMTDRQVKESFYDAETVFEQMIVGLQNVASDSADQSYSFIMQNYVNFSEAKRNTEFQKEYLKSIRSAVAKSETETDKYDVRKLMLYVDAGLDVGIVDPSPTSGSWIGARDNTKIGTEYEYKSRYGVMEAPSGADYIRLKGLHLEYTDGDGFLSMIDTDIMITTPDAGFTQSGRISNVFDYGIIADKGIEIAAGTGGDINDVTIRGNVYAGENGLIKDAEGNVVADHTGEGIIVNKAAKLTVEKADMLVSKGGVFLKDGSSLKVGKGAAAGDMTDFWTADIKMEQSKTGGDISLYGHTFVKDDLTVSADNAAVHLTGSYYGYGDGADKAENSSAIIVNGEGNTLDLTGLSHLLLAGHAYTSVGGDTVKNQYTELAGLKTKVEIPTGESIAIKGNQIAYLVPDECIGVLYGQPKFGRNPLSKQDYETLVNSYASNTAEYGSSFKMVDVNRQIEKLGGKTLASYGITYPAGIKEIFIPSNGETMVYFYLAFTSQADAERYFADYYEVNKEKLNRYADVYASGGIKSPDSYTRITVQGNYMETDQAAGEMALKSRTDNISAGNDLDLELQAYQNTFESLTTALTQNFLAVTAQEKTRTVYENIVDNTAFETRVKDDSGNRDTWKITEGVSGDYHRAVLANKDTVAGDGASPGYTFNDTEKRSSTDTEHVDVVLIISSGDVVVEKDFEGVIIAGGKVIIKNGATVTSAKVAGKMSELVRVLQQTRKASDPTSKPLSFIRNASQYVLAGTALTKDDEASRKENIDFANFVKYQNWTKK